MVEVTDIKGIGPAKAETLAENGYESVDDVATADQDELAEVDGVGDDRALEFIVEAQNLVEDADAAEESEDGEDSFDLTPAEVSEELKEDEEEIVVEDEDSDDDSEVEDESQSESETEEDDEYSISLSFESQLQYDTFHAALMRYHEDVYTSNQPASDAIQRCLDQLSGQDDVTYTLTESEINTLHTAVKQTRTYYQGNNLIDHMDALKVVEEKLNDQRKAALF